MDGALSSLFLQCMLGVKADSTGPSSTFSARLGVIVWNNMKTLLMAGSVHNHSIATPL